MGNIETKTKFSRLKSISNIEDNYYFICNLFVFKCLFTITKENHNPLLRGKFSLKLHLTKSDFLKELAKIYMVKFNVLILNRLKIIGFL